MDFTAGLMPLDTALAQMLDRITPLNATETVPLLQAFSRVTAHDIVSPLDVPGFDNAAMDGYAVRLNDLRDGAALPVAKKDEIKTGRAAILATVSGNETREYDIEIEKIYSPSGSTRNLLLHVTDEELLTQTGGVVQGMSGSAILQDGKIIGAVTHVLLDDPSRGYGIFIENMLSAAGLSSE